MFYTIYKTTNTINGKYYIGMHKTNDLNDGYLGSGKLLRQALTKYGREAFAKEILHVFDNEGDMKAKEKELVIVSEETYNLCDGGHGGWSYVNRVCRSDEKHVKKWKQQLSINSPKSKPWQIGRKLSLETREKISRNLMGRPPVFLGKHHTQECKNRISATMKTKTRGANNSQYGTCWITNGIENKKISKADLDKYVEMGYNRGRKF